MLFNSFEFLIFFPIVLAVCFLLPAKVRYLWLLASSYYFYMCWDARYVLLLLFSTAVTYLGGLGIQWCREQSWDEERKIKGKKLCVGISVVLNIGLLAYFKYTNFLLENIQGIFGLFHIEIHPPEFSIVLPVGISFFTFQALSYTMDVYREDIYAEKNFFRYALFVSFFPQLVAGPIERSQNLLKQLSRPPRFQWENGVDGMMLMLWGFFLKVVIADRIAIFVDTVYNGWRECAGIQLLAAALLFVVQVYCDFSGYSTIARGAAKVMGYNIMDNFKSPFYALTIAEMWRRWHISLNSWFRDYLYIPLGGNRRGAVRKQVNIIIVFFLSGLWHGANWTYVIWGLLNGGYQIVGRFMQPIRDRVVVWLGLNRESTSHRVIRRVNTFLLFAFSMIFFRADDVSQAVGVIGRIISNLQPQLLFDGILYNCGLDEKNVRLMFYAILLLFVADYFKYKGIKIREIVRKQEYWFRVLFVAASVVFLLVAGIWGSAYEAANFIYFQF